MKTYNEMITEITFSNPFKAAAIRGALSGIEDVARYIVGSAARFVVTNPGKAFGIALGADLLFLRGTGAKMAAEYFSTRFPGHALSVYQALAKITVDNKLDLDDVGDALIASVEKAGGTVD